jgi:Phosphatidylinositol 3- and 4-kinase
MPKGDFQSLTILDISLCNTDRNLGNAMYAEAERNIFPIDHALILPSGYRSSAVFAWMLWDWSLVRYDAPALEEIQRMNFEADAAKILEAYPHYPVESLETMRINYYLLKQGAKAKLSPFFIGCFLTGAPLSPMAAMYQKVRKASENDPKKTYALMTQCLDASIQHLLSSPLIVTSKTSLATLKDEAEFKLLSFINKFSVS